MKVSKIYTEIPANGHELTDREYIRAAINPAAEDGELLKEFNSWESAINFAKSAVCGLTEPWEFFAGGKRYFAVEYISVEDDGECGNYEVFPKFKTLYPEDVEKMVLEAVDLYPEEAEEYKEKDMLTVNTGKDGRSYVWFFDGKRNAAADLETGRFLSEKEIEEQFC